MRSRYTRRMSVYRSASGEGFQPFLLQAIIGRMRRWGLWVDRAHFRNRWSLRRNERPVRFVRRPSRNPIPECLLLFGGERGFRGGWRHHSSVGSVEAMRAGVRCRWGVTEDGFRASTRLSSRSFALRAASSGPWHLKHRAARIGRTSRLKSEYPQPRTDAARDHRPKRGRQPTTNRAGREASVDAP